MHPDICDDLIIEGWAVGLGGGGLHSQGVFLVILMIVVLGTAVHETEQIFSLLFADNLPMSLFQCPKATP